MEILSGLRVAAGAYLSYEKRGTPEHAAGLSQG